MNDRSIIQAPQPEPGRDWLQAYLPDGQVAPHKAQQKVISLDLIRGIIFRQRWLIAATLFVSVLAGIIVNLLATPMYEATAKVRVEPYGSNILAGQDVQQDIASNQVFDLLSTHVEVIKSRSTAEVVVDSLKLTERADLLGSNIDEQRPPNVSDAQWQQSKKDMAVSILAGSVEAKVPERSWIIPISFRSENRVLAAEIANGYAEAFVSSGVRKSVDDNEYALTYLQQEIQTVRGRLEDAEKAANLYARNAGIIVQGAGEAEDGSGSTPTMKVANMTSINERVSLARAARIEAEQRWRSIQNLPASQLPEVQSNGVLQGLLAQRATKSTQLVELRQKYNDDFPEIVTIKSQIDTLNEQIDRISADVKATVRNQYIVALNQETALQRELESSTGATLAEQDLQVQYSGLEREAKGLRDQLSALLARYNEISSAANVNTGEITKLDMATIPSAPYAPDPIKNMLLAIIAGIGLAGALGVLREVFDDRIRSLDDLEERLGLPLLGHTPHVEDSDILADGSNRFSALMEAYSSIRAGIDFSLPRSHNVIQFTSSKASEGKSTTAVILAELFASLGRRTLLIDADLRRPSVQKLLGLERPKAGLVEVVLGHVKLEDVVVKGVHENLEILPVSEIPPNPTEILASYQMKEFIEKYRHEYSLIIFDSCPVMGLADAPVLANLVDGTIFVLEANGVPFGQARAALRRVEGAGGNVIGAILTKFKALQAGQSYDYQYGYYQYGRDT